jgi:hypothetical protein
MATKQFSDYPILIELTHDDTPIATYTDELGTYNVYRYTSVHYLNRTDKAWTVSAQDTAGRTYTVTLQAFVEGTVSIPPARRVRSNPLTISITFVEA